jgi:hypothetical protein
MGRSSEDRMVHVTCELSHIAGILPFWALDNLTSCGIPKIDVQQM